MYSDFRILIVDDFALIRTMLRQSLIGLGFSNIDEAVDGLEAFEKIEAASQELNPYRVVFADWNMPRMSGLELIERMKASADFSELPVIMISAEREQSNIIRAIEAGALAFITKPFSPATLHSKLQAIMIGGSESAAANE